MRYFLQAVSYVPQLPFEQEVYSKREYKSLKRTLKQEGYTDFYLDIRWSNLDEVYDSLNTLSNGEN